MRNRDWFELAARLLGFWLVIHSVISSASILLYAFSGQSSIWLMALSSLIWAVLQCAFGIALIFFAAAIAKRLYPDDRLRPNDEADAETGQFHPLQIGIQLIGVVALLMAVQSVGSLATHLIPTGQYLAAGFNRSYLHDLVSLGANLVFGVGLIAWNDRIITLIEKVRYVPERDAFEPTAISLAPTESGPKEDS